jgi:short-subunit dehydrogenase involved in D-alanine esterification of teichoic acids
MTSARLDGLTVLVIGGSSGIGHEIARQARPVGRSLSFLSGLRLAAGGA